jgi:AcrR family transcriptional regulator
MSRITREQSMARTRALLLDAAGAVFAERGFAAASLDEISEQAGFTRGAVYSNFRGKDELFLAVLERDLESGASTLGSVIETSDDVGRVFEHLGDERWGFEDLQQFLLLSEFRLYALRTSDVRDRLARHERIVREAYRHAVEAMAGLLDVSLPADAADIALVFQSLENGLALLRHLDPDQVPATSVMGTLSLVVSAFEALGRERAREGGPSAGVNDVARG